MPINERILSELVKKTELSIRENSLTKTLITMPQSLLVIRLSLGKSQREFMRLLKGNMSQPMLIRHETGKSRVMMEKTAKELAKTLFEQNLKLSKNIVFENFQKFKEMQHGHMTSKEAKLRQKIWLQKTTREQRQMWGKMGAEIANKTNRFTISESKVREILNELSLPYKTHQQISIDEKLGFNVDFLINGKNKIVIEVTERQKSLTILSQALAFRSITLHQKFPGTVFIALVPENITLIGNEVLRRSCDKVFTINQLDELKEFIGRMVTSSG